MSLAHAVLTSLIEKSSSGYELARRFDKSIGYFWHATHQQIYRELARWAQAPSEPMDLRDEFMVKLRADAALGEINLRDELRRRIALHQEKLAHYRAIEQRDFPPGAPLSREARIHHMILKKGILYEQGSIAWNTEMLEML